MKRKPVPLATQLASGLMALAALTACLMSGVDPVTSLVRGGIAYLVGRSLAGLWCALFPASDVDTVVELEVLKPGATEVSDEEKAAA
ncbi:MAG: hypothetical protein KIT11_04270 [Fimbriimonadaceae bacterium]|nr:hypothetical protein [Fimbriimonadaceae bacterium]QYK56889.1 MAG: hypothetical protein KF733_05255 [Fimbriimonadaceae bacterium]